MLIEMHIDLICPWCLIGKRRLDRALAGRPGLMIDLAFQPFQLNPDMPPGGMERPRYMSMKFGGAARAAQVYQMIEQAAAREGLSIRFDRIARTPNTVDAHRLVRLADDRGCAAAMVEALFTAYFLEGRDIGDRSVLAEIGAAVTGGAPDRIRTHLESEAEVAAVRAADRQSRTLGIQAVPYFVFNRRYGLAGAQEVETFGPFLDLAALDQGPHAA
ncbi:MAG: hypothetical protein RLY86_3889 [Pseudomonadota bacterium]|jgi:predicted DsbA family dithiol-disulfide isomerase